MGRHLRHAMLLAAAALVPAGLSAQTSKAWIGGTWADFATNANWTGGAAPANSTATNYALFNSATDNRAQFLASRSVAGADFTGVGLSGLSYTGSNIVLTLGAFGLRTSSIQTVDIDVALALGANSSFTDNGAGLWISSALNLGANSLTLGGNSTNGYSRLVGLISGTGGITLNQSGSYGWLLGSNNTYTGNTTLTAGTLISGDNGFGTGTLIFNGGKLGANSAVSYHNAVSVANTAYFVPGSGPITLNGAVTMTASRTFDVSGSGSVVLTGALGQGAAGYSLTKSGTGALVLNGTSNYTGATIINGGTLAFGPTAPLNNANLALNGGVISTSGTFSRLIGTGAGQVQFLATGGGFAAYGGALTVTGYGAYSYWDSYFNNQHIYLNSTVANNVVTMADSIMMPSGDYFLTVADNTSSTADKAVFAGVLSGDGRLNKEGDGVLELSAANTYTGGTTSLGGTLRLTNAGALGTGSVTLQSSTLELATDAALDLANNFNATSGTVTITSDRLTAGEGLMHQLGNYSGSGTAVIQKGANVTSGIAGLHFDAVTGGSFNVSAGVKLELGSYASTVSTAFTGAGDTTILGTFTTGTGTLTKNGTGSLTLLGSSTRTGPTTFSGGSLVLGADTALGTGLVTVASSPTLSGTAGARTIAAPFNLNSGLTITGTSDLTFTGAITNVNNSTLTVTNTGTTTFTGAINLSNSSANRVLTINNAGAVVLTNVIVNGSTSPASALTKTGAGVLTLSGNSFFNGDLTVNAGTLNLIGSLPYNLTTVANGATFTGGGSLHNLSLAGIYAPGVSIAQVQLDNLTMASTAILQMEIAGATPGTGHDQLQVAGLLTAAGTLNVTFANGFTPSASSTFDLFNFGAASGSFAAVNLPTLGADWTWDTTSLLTTGELSLNFSPVPEPSTYALLATGLGLAVIARRRRNSSRS